MRINKIVDTATMALVWVGGLLVLGVMLLTIGDIVSRWAFAKGFIGLVDVTQFAVVGFAYLALPRVFWTDANVAIELYDDRLSPRADAALRAFALMLAIGIVALLLRYGWVQAERTLRYGDISQNIGIPMVGFWALILCGLAMSGLICLLRLWQCAATLVSGKRADAH
ncbi:TRAP transporter small permease [Yoonia sp. SS1-5]|uniref:TRAP transporter small permease protein n=1 Tax=Yoonia rhodophyticola TaxID=3137370 RepID=A0AAN0MED5_9RHOB